MFSLRPCDLGDLTPAQLNACGDVLDEMRKAVK